MSKIHEHFFGGHDNQGTKRCPANGHDLRQVKERANVPARHGKPNEDCNNDQDAADDDNHLCPP
jgi:hypothetical protein